MSLNKYLYNNILITIDFNFVCTIISSTPVKNLNLSVDQNLKSKQAPILTIIQLIVNTE